MSIRQEATDGTFVALVQPELSVEKKVFCAEQKAAYEAAIPIPALDLSTDPPCRRMEESKREFEWSLCEELRHHPTLTMWASRSYERLRTTTYRTQTMQSAYPPSQGRMST